MVEHPHAAVNGEMNVCENDAEIGSVHVPSLPSSKPAEMRSFYPGADIRE